MSPDIGDRWARRRQAAGDRQPDPGAEEEVFAIVEIPPSTDEERLDLYAIYREMNGAPFEPSESQLQAKLSEEQDAEE